MRGMMLVVILGVLGGCAPSWDDSCAGWCDWMVDCYGPSSVVSHGVCIEQHCSDGQDRYGFCWHEIWDWMDCVTALGCTDDPSACDGALGPCRAEVWE